MGSRAITVAVTVGALAAACSSKSSAPAGPPPDPGSGPVAIGDAGGGDRAATTAPLVAADTSPPARVDLAAALPPVDFVPRFAPSTDAARTREAAALDVAGLKLHAQEDWAGAEAKYTAALAVDAGHRMARYNLACAYNRSGRGDRALALLAELARAGCARCTARARWDDDWRSQFGEPVFWQVLALERTTADDHDDDDDSADDGDDDLGIDDEGGAVPALRCPTGTRQVGTWDPDRDRNEIFCARGSVRHGPYRFRELGYDLGEGVSSASGSYRNGKQHGLWYRDESIGPDGEHGAYLDGVAHGVWDTWRRGAHSTKAFVRGTAVGAELTWDDDDTLIGEQHHVGGKLDGVAREWTRDGDDLPYYLSKRVTYDKGAPVSVVEYDGPGRISLQGSYAAGEQTGRWTTYRDGKKRAETSHDHGVLHGEQLTYDERGLRTSVGHWDRGKRHGEFAYWKDGQPLASTAMDHDSGDWIRYRDGALVERGRLAAGVREGAWVFEDESAREWLEGAYAAGKRDGAWVHYRGDDHRARVAEGGYRADVRQGPWTLYSREVDEPVVATGSYAGGKLDGAWTLRDPGEDEVVQVLDFRKGKLVKVDGERAGEPFQRGYRASTWPDHPQRVEAREPDGFFDE
jgi:antitoxin component YwqK of YwqJK toxin-antitoxin module